MHLSPPIYLEGEEEEKNVVCVQINQSLATLRYHQGYLLHFKFSDTNLATKVVVIITFSDIKVAILHGAQMLLRIIRATWCFQWAQAGSSAKFPNPASPH